MTDRSSSLSAIGREGAVVERESGQRLLYCLPRATHRTGRGDTSPATPMVEVARMQAEKGVPGEGGLRQRETATV